MVSIHQTVLNCERCMRVKLMQEEEFKQVLSLNWKPVELIGEAVPEFLRGIPDHLSPRIYASGSIDQSYLTGENPIPSGMIIGGIDVYRDAPDDPVNLNKDWYPVIIAPGYQGYFLVKGPLKDHEHWLNEIPEHLRGAVVLLVPPKQN